MVEAQVIRQLNRPFWTDAEEREIYRSPFDHRVLGWGQDARIATSVMIGRLLFDQPERVADLSCGNGVVARALSATQSTILGDLAPGFELCGPIEETIAGVDRVDTFVCLETLEHLHDPDLVLREIRSCSHTLLCSVPLCRVPEDDGNGEHYWVFDRAGFEAALAEAGWNLEYFAEVPAAPGTMGRTYQCGIWGCS